MPTLKKFYELHNTSELIIDGIKWEYIIAGKRKSNILILPGGASTAESTFPLILAFEQNYNVIAPSYHLILAKLQL